MRNAECGISGWVRSAPWDSNPAHLFRMPHSALRIRFFSMVDVTLPDGDGIPIEQRPPEEVTTLAGRRVAPSAAAALNPAFDVTPARYVTGYLTDRGLVKPPFAA